MFLSVIIPTFNAANHLHGALQSLETQTFRDFEVIVVDGLSGDNTKEVFEKSRSSFAHSVWISEKDRGIYDAMNKGIKASKGDWIYLLGSDDRLYAPEVLANIHHFITTNNVDVVYGNVFSKAFSGGKIPYAGPFTPYKLYIQNICHQALFFKRSVFERVGPFSMKYKVLADWEHNYRWFLSGSIKHQYFDIIVADFGHAGISQNIIDRVFFRDRDWNYAISGRFSIGWKGLIWHILKEYKLCLRERNFSRLFEKMLGTPAIIFGRQKYDLGTVS